MAEVPLPTPTQAPVPSTDIRNAVFAGAKLDEEVTGIGEFYTDRLGVKRLTNTGRTNQFNVSQNERSEIFNRQLAEQEGIFESSQTDKENRFQQFLLSSGYVFLGDYENGPWQFSARNQYIRYDGQYWRLAPTAPSNFTTTGVTASTFEVDKLNLVAMDSDVLRQELAGSSGAELVSYSFNKHLANIRSLQSRLNDAVSILDFAPDSADDDSSRFYRAQDAGVTSLFIPSSAVLMKSIGRRNLRIKEVTISSAMSVHGFGTPSWQNGGGELNVIKGAEFGFKFEGVLGGGLSGIKIAGDGVDNQAIAIIGRSCSGVVFDRVSVIDFRNYAYHLSDFMEGSITYGFINRVGSDATGALCLSDYLNGEPNRNVNNLLIHRLTLGSCSGKWINVSDNANADLIWVSNCKFEWDSTVESAKNLTRKPVIYVGGAERFKITDCGFTYFKGETTNLYDTILETGTKAYYGIEFRGNQAWGCEGSKFWWLRGGILNASGNTTNTVMSILNESPHAQATMEYPAIRTIAGNQPLSYKPKNREANFVPAHELTGPNRSNNFATTAGAVAHGTSMVADAYSEIRRMYIPRDMVSAKRVIKVTARCKNENATDARVKLSCDGVDVNNYNSNLEDQLAYKVIPANSDWSMYSWYITPAMISTGTLLLFNQSTDITFHFDGMSVEYADYYDLTVPWSAGTIAANTISSTSVYMARLAPYIKGVSLPKTDNSLGGAIATAYFEGSTNNLTLLATRVGSTAATVAATSFMIRVFLK
ncbi:hypothetical protein [Klebsiella pneumoniae]|uniref:hypothetical protein n=2 Tax=Klebsiella pneumoniae TaxID=573 RepID=UPI00226DEA52|nr:hypothetical protein [Klebsiella pneumoniae]MCY0496945.1 hypothetical protein [Klebsiella pneumoniae]